MFNVIKVVLMIVYIFTFLLLNHAVSKEIQNKNKGLALFYLLDQSIIIVLFILMVFDFIGVKVG